jgi:hypothetical protein
MLIIDFNWVNVLGVSGVEFFFDNYIISKGEKPSFLKKLGII